MLHICRWRIMETGTSGWEKDRSIHALRRRPLPGNRARSARGGRASVLLVGAGGAWRAGPPCRPDEARRARAVAHWAAAHGRPKVEGARLASVRVELGLPWIGWVEVGWATGQAGWDVCGTGQGRIGAWDSVTMMSVLASHHTSDQYLHALSSNKRAAGRRSMLCSAASLAHTAIHYHTQLQ